MYAIETQGVSELHSSDVQLHYLDDDVIDYDRGRAYWQRGVAVETGKRHRRREVMNDMLKCGNTSKQDVGR